MARFDSSGVHATDFSCASSTQLFDPFIMQWSVVISRLYGVPQNILPETRDTAYIRTLLYLPVSPGDIIFSEL